MAVTKKTAAKKPAAKAAAKPAAKTAAKKPAAKKAAAKPAAAKKAVAAKPAAKKAKGAVAEAMSKTAILTEIAESTELTKKQVGAVMEELAGLIERHVKKNAVGQFTLAGLFKIQVVHKPATKARKGKNPFTGEEIMIKAKPARNTIKIRPLKKLKDMAS